MNPTSRYRSGRFAANPGIPRRSTGVVTILLAVAPLLPAASLPVPNASFESPATTFADPRLDDWQKTPKPVWYDEQTNGPWDQLVGVFKNTEPGSTDHIGNVHGAQALFFFALPEVGIFQDRQTTAGFDARFEVGKAYSLTVGAIGGGGGMKEGATMAVGLYYRDDASNRVSVASTTLTHSAAQFPNLTNLVAFRAHVPTVRAGDAWAGRQIGVQLLSTVTPELVGGYWDLEHVRLEEVIEIPNGSFESPETPFADPREDAWQSTPKPVWWDEATYGPWDQLTGVFKNTDPGSADHIDNVDGGQALFLFAQPEVGLFQDYDSIDESNSVPTHAFDTRFETGKEYTLTVGVMGGGGAMTNGVTLQLALYYRNAQNERVVVAATTVTHSTNTFPNLNHLVDFSVTVPAVRSTDTWAGQHAGVLLLSTVEPQLAGGYWDVDHVRLTSRVAPTLTPPATEDGQFSLTLRSEPDLKFDVLAHADAAAPQAEWTVLTTLTNTTGRVVFRDPAAGLARRFYQARQRP